MKGKQENVQVWIFFRLGVGGFKPRGLSSETGAACTASIKTSVPKPTPSHETPRTSGNLPRNNCVSHLLPSLFPGLLVVLMFVPLGFRILYLVQPQKKTLKAHIFPLISHSTFSAVLIFFFFPPPFSLWRQFKEKQIPGALETPLTLMNKWLRRLGKWPPFGTQQYFSTNSIAHALPGSWRNDRVHRQFEDFAFQ